MKAQLKFVTVLRTRWPWRVVAGLALASSLFAHPSIQSSAAPVADPPCGTPPASGSVKFAVIGDYGKATASAEDASHEAAVAALVHGWSPDLILTVGDNNYPVGGADTVDANIGQYYHDYICPYAGAYGGGSSINRFFPSAGNHDWDSAAAPNGLDPYLDYFELPASSSGNERYYDFTWGPAHFFMLDSDIDEPDGITADSVQGQWLQSELAASTSPWDLVFFHHAPYSSGAHGSTTVMRWPFREWGADAVFAGHDHSYERIVLSGFPYFVDGLGGAPRYGFGTPIQGSQVRYSSDWGAMLMEVTPSHIAFKFMNTAAQLVDSFGMSQSGVAPADFGGDGTSDIVVYRAGAWRRYDFATATYLGSTITGASGSCTPAAMDYDGDGAKDFTQVCGGWWYFYNADGSYNKGIWVGNASGQRPVPADYDGDGTEDVVLFRAGAWHAWDFASGAYLAGSSVWTGMPGSGTPAPMDYDGDGHADRTYMATSGAWHFYNANGSYNKGIWIGNVAGQVPVPGDYDGDGTDEPVVFRGGGWRFYDLATAAFQTSVWTGAPTSSGGGTPGPAPLDHSGDGKLDFGFYGGKAWHFYNANGSYNKGIWIGATPGDMPISRRPLP